MEPVGGLLGASALQPVLRAKLLALNPGFMAKKMLFFWWGWGRGMKQMASH
jgi:1-acyl-sn-glycerol-3-phosphate acyltransferase